MATEAVRMSNKLAKKYGAYPKCNNDNLALSYLINKLENEDITNNIKKYGLRNSQLLTIAPTGSISTMWNVSGGIEPLFAKKFTRTTKSLHDKDVTYDVFPKIVEKDKIYKQYKALIDGLFDALHENEATRKVAQFRSNMKGSANIGREREKLLRAYENMRNEIKTYENNIGFFSMSKNAEPLIRQMQEKIEKSKEELKNLAAQIKALKEAEE